ncbi:MAG: RidA family protein [Deltaproteobacteria bacterium]|nr:RidA family protein [Deltaproteobacteria bacterium]
MAPPLSIDQRLLELQITLPEVQSAGLYQPAVRSGNLLFVSGQLPRSEGKIAFKGKLGQEVNLESGRRGARVAMINALAVIKGELGTLDKVKQVLRLTGYVASATGFTDQPKVMDGASELLVELFGNAGRHSRAAVGVAELPLGACVEVDLILEIK